MLTDSELVYNPDGEGLSVDKQDTELDQYISKRITKMELVEMRKSAHLTQKDVSNATGLSVQCISDIENENGGNPTLKSLIKYADSLGYELCFRKKV